MRVMERAIETGETFRTVNSDNDITNESDKNITPIKSILIEILYRILFLFCTCIISE